MLKLRKIQILSLGSNLSIYDSKPIRLHINDVTAHAWTLTNQKRSTCQVVISLNTAIVHTRITLFRISLQISKQRTCLICWHMSLAT